MRPPRRPRRAPEGEAPAPRLVIEAAERAGEVEVALEGELGIYTARRLRDALEPFERPGVARLVVDLTRVRFLDSAGLRALANARRRLARLGAGFALICPPPLRATLRAGGLGAVLDGAPARR